MTIYLKNKPIKSKSSLEMACTKVLTGLKRLAAEGPVGVLSYIMFCKAGDKYFPITKLSS